MTSGQLVELARRLGVADAYVDVDGVRHRTSPTTLAAVCELLDRDTDAVASTDRPAPIEAVVVARDGRLVGGVAERFDEPLTVTVSGDDGDTRVQAASRAELERALAEVPIGRHQLEYVTDGHVRSATLLMAPGRFPATTAHEPALALFTPTYTLWSTDEPRPCYDHLARLGAAVADGGVDVIATLPLYASGLGARFEASPYSPLSRFHHNELLVPDRLLTPAPQPDAAPVRDNRLDWPQVVRTRSDQLSRAVAELTPSDRHQLSVFCAEHPEVVSYATWAAAAEGLDPDRYQLGQWRAEQALVDATAALTERGLGLALDLPVGSRADSWETARWPDLFVTEAAMGAPPDSFFTAGQNWGLPPVDPGRSRRDGHRFWYELLHAACRHAAVLRIDHVMQVHRMWWVPAGHQATDGAYVHYPAHELLAVAAIVAHRTNTMMVGEDLGTVPPAVRRLLTDWGLPGMHEEGFWLHGWDRRAPSTKTTTPTTADPLPPVPAGTWAGIRTHDMPSLAALDAELVPERYRRALAAELGVTVGAASTDLAAAMVERMRRSRALAVVLDLDDALGVTEAHNVPGTVADTNWCRRLDQPVEALADDPRLRRALTGPTAVDATTNGNLP